jgi:outer membrane assembly lipoprotein YfiO
VILNLRARKHRTAAVLYSVVIGGLTLAAVSGCSSSNPHPPGSYERGVYYQEKKRCTQAIKAFEVFVRANPTDSLAAEAQYRKARCYLDLHEYPLAVVEFQILRKDHPISPRVEDAYYWEGMAYMSQVGRVERDLTGVEEARLHFLELAQRYPDSEYLPDVRVHMQEMSDMMVRKRLGAVQVYRQLGRYEAANITLDDILTDERNSTLLDEVMIWRAEISRKTGDYETGIAICERLLDEYPDSRFVRRARKLHKDLREKLAELYDYE